MCIIDCRRPSFFVSRGKLLVSSSSVLGPSLHLSASASASTRDAPICHLPAAFAEHYGSITHRTVPGIPTVHALTVAARSTARRCTFAQTVRKDASIALLTTISPPPINQHAVQSRWGLSSPRHCTARTWDTGLDGPTWTIPSHRAPGHHHASAPAVPLPAVARRTLAILSSLRPSRPRSTRSRPGLPPLNTIRTACVPTRCRLPQLVTLHSTSSSSTLSAPTRSPSRMG